MDGSDRLQPPVGRSSKHLAHIGSACCAWKRAAQTAACQPTTLLSFFSHFFLSKKKRHNWNAKLPAQPADREGKKRKLQPSSQESSLLVLQHVGAEGRIHLLPAAQVCCSFVQEVAVACR